MREQEMTETALRGLAEDPRWLLTERVTASAAFAKSTRLIAFLRFVARETIAGHADRINEQVIGEQVFERTQGYDPGQDNIVRVNAARLRQRLAMYFAGEGAGETTRICIPKGGYEPRFESVCPPSAEITAPSDIAEALSPAVPLPFEAAAKYGFYPESAASQSRTGWLVAAGLAGVMASAVVWIFSTGGNAIRASQARHAAPASPLWRALFKESRPALIVPADSGLVLYESQANKAVDLQSYLSSDVQTVPQINPAATFDKANSKTGYRYTSVVDLEIATKLISLPETDARRPVIRYARDLKMSDLKDANVILLGAKDANPWVELFEGQMNFALDVDRKTHDSVVTNRRPLPQESARYYRHPNDGSNTAYAVAAFLPGLNKTGDVLILEGTTMVGTEAAADFIFSPGRLDAVVGTHGRDLPHFELLLQTTSVGGSARDPRLIASRIYPRN